MLFDTLVNNGKTYNRAIDMVLEKCGDAIDHYAMCMTWKQLEKVIWII